jgi:hypothetical protein
MKKLLPILLIGFMTITSCSKEDVGEPTFDCYECTSTTVTTYQYAPTVIDIEKLTDICDVTPEELEAHIKKNSGQTTIGRNTSVRSTVCKKRKMV